MAKSEYQFARWNAQLGQTWRFSLYKKHQEELRRTGAAHYTALKFVYRGLGKSNASLQDQPLPKFGFASDEVGRYQTIKEWSDHYNEFDNWVHLSTLLSLASNLETFLASVTSLALRSDPGVIIGSSRAIDGMALVKAGRSNRLRLQEKSLTEDVTVGDWSSRIDAFESVFGDNPVLRAAHSDLEQMRIIRNEIGHAFGRDIDKSRELGEPKKLPIRKLSHARLRGFFSTSNNVARSIDLQLLANHIGEYEMLEFYRKFHEGVSDQTAPNRAIALKKEVGRSGSVPRGKLFCRGLVDYWDSL